MCQGLCCSSGYNNENHNKGLPFMELPFWQSRKTFKNKDDADQKMIRKGLSGERT